MAETRKALVVGIGGTLRSGSSGERLARAVLCECERLGAQTIMFPGSYLSELPHFSPDSKARTAGERALVDAVRACDGLVIASPGYQGGKSGLVKCSQRKIVCRCFYFCRFFRVHVKTPTHTPGLRGMRMRARRTRLRGATLLKLFFH